MTTVRQEETSVDGKKLFSRVQTAGLEEPFVIFGSKLTGCEYERTSSGIGGWQAGNKKSYYGLAAFQLK